MDLWDKDWLMTKITPYKLQIKNLILKNRNNKFNNNYNNTKHKINWMTI